MKRILPAATAALLLVGLAGCSQQDTPAPAQQAAAPQAPAQPAAQPAMPPGH
ncbi:MAG: hypothetical protein GWP66_07990, partial [Gammaproteobacteria bacterium]|nr:hypothetical protein [Gammaproteobacteria bacterium]